MLKLNPSLHRLPVYRPGRTVEAVAREHGFSLAEVAKLASNENPLGPSPAAIQAIQNASSSVNLYPDGDASTLKNRLSETLNLAPANILLGNGSNELIEFVAHALLKPGDNIVVSQYCFAIYPLVARLFGAEVITVPASNFGSDTAAMIEAVTPATKALFIANPNNPTGTLAGAQAIEKLIDRIPSRVLVVMDEAYIEYLDHPQNLLPKIRDNKAPNLLLMRTFSKIHGLAGLRLGYGLGAETLIRALEKIRQPFNVNALAQAAALASLNDLTHAEKSRRHNRREREKFEEFCQAQRCPYVPSFANFVLLRVGDGQKTYQTLLTKGVITRPMNAYGLPEWLRISIGTSAENQKCMKALSTLLNQNNSQSASGED